MCSIILGEEMLFNPYVLVTAFGKRDRVTILMDILKSARRSREGKKKTQILQSANLNYHQVNKYLHLLMINGFVLIDGDARYRITDRGLQFVKTLENLNLTLK